jgi:hypothetical protein
MRVLPLKEGVADLLRKKMAWPGRLDHAETAEPLILSKYRFFYAKKIQNIMHPSDRRGKEVLIYHESA